METDAAARIYSVRRPLAAFCAGATVAILGGLIGLGGAELRLPLLIAVFELYPHRAVRINLLISFATLAVAGVARFGFVGAASLTHHAPETAAMAAAALLAAWLGAGWLARIPKARMTQVIIALLVGVSALLLLETAFAGSTALALPADPGVRVAAALLAGLLVGSVSSLLGVAGGEFIIPIMIFLFGADIATAGTASVLISTPAVLAGIIRHWLAGMYRSRSMLTFLAIPMSAGSVVGALAGGYLAASVPGGALRLVLAAVLAVSAVKLLRKRRA